MLNETPPSQAKSRKRRVIEESESEDSEVQIVEPAKSQAKKQKGVCSEVQIVGVVSELCHRFYR